MYNDFAATMESSDDLTASDVAKSVIVIMSFIAVWSIIIAIVAVQEFWKYGKKVSSTHYVLSLSLLYLSSL